MDIAQSLITGVVQGLTEFLPVSSTGHIVLASSLYQHLTGHAINTGSNEEIFFDIMIHMGTLMAVFVYFWSDIVKLIKVFFKSISSKTFKETKEAHIPVYIILGTFASAVIALLFKDYFEADMDKPAIVGLQIIATGVLLFATEYMSTRIKNVKNELTWIKSLIIGLAQGIAISPGISRSGTTIAAGLATGMDRVSAARFSFLLSIPIIVLAAISDTLDKVKDISAFASYNWTAIILGTIASGIVGYYCIKYFLIYLSNNKLNGFAVYCCIIGLFMYIYFGFFV